METKIIAGRTEVVVAKIIMVVGLEQDWEEDAFLQVNLIEDIEIEVVSLTLPPLRLVFLPLLSVLSWWRMYLYCARNVEAWFPILHDVTGHVT